MEVYTYLSLNPTLYLLGMSPDAGIEVPWLQLSWDLLTKTHMEILEPAGYDGRLLSK